MATLEQLESRGELCRYSADLETWEMPDRCISHTPQFGAWLQMELMNEPTKRGRNTSPYEQVEQLFYEFIVGQPMAYSVHYRKLEPIACNVWELKTVDVRVFGWLTRKCHFLAVFGEFKDNLKIAKLYKPYVEAVCAFRDGLDLDEPKSVYGVCANDVL